jgi:chromatin remodeling complex protein RSC6
MPSKSNSKTMKTSSKSSQNIKQETIPETDSVVNESDIEPQVSSTEPQVSSTETQVSSTETQETLTDLETDTEIETVQFIIKRMNERRIQMAYLQREDKTDAKLLERCYLTEKRSMKKRRQKGGSSNTKKAPSGFAKPTKISSELRKFISETSDLKLNSDSLLARTEVTKKITLYIKEQNLQNPANRREIFPDDRLGDLVCMDAEVDSKLTYFNLQRCIKHHFPKQIPISSETK